MDISLLSKKLRQYIPVLQINQPTATEILKVEMLTQEQGNFDPSVLYLLQSYDLLIDNLDSGLKNILLFNNSKQNLESYRENLKTNYICITRNTDIFSIFTEIKHIIENYNKYEYYHLNLHQLLFQDAGLHQIMKTGSEILGAPLLLEDVRRRLISHSFYDEEDLVMNYNYSTKTNHQDYTKYSFPLHINDLPRMVATISIENEPIAYLSVVGTKKALRKTHSDFLILICKFLSLEMQKNKYKYYFKQHSYEYIIHDLIEGTIDMNLPIEQIIMENGMTLKANLYLLTISTKQYQNYGCNILKLTNALESLITNCKLIVYNDNILLIIHKDSNEVLEISELNSVRSFLKDYDFYGGLSLQFHSIKDIKKYYLQTLNAIKLGVHLKKDLHLFLFKDFLFYHMLEHCKEKVDLFHFCHPTLLTLIEYDKKNKTDFVETLYEYVKHNGNYKDTATVLHIFNNTLVYRLKRIRAIIRTKIDVDYFFQLELSFKILEYLNKLDFLH